MKNVPITSIITIGDELLIGQVIDTNSAWMAQELGKKGIAVSRRVAVGDNWESIWNTLDEESKQANIILITGGLGPTADDITKPLLAKYFDAKLVMNAEAERMVRHRFEHIFKKQITERNLKQAEVPDNCTVIQNKRGTAPGMLFQKNDAVYISMPGVPFEMQGMITDDVIPFIEEHFELPYITHRTLVTYGIGESYLADLIVDFEENLPAQIKLAYLPNFGMVRLRLSGSGLEKDQVNSTINELFDDLQSRVADYIITNEDLQMHEILLKLLNSKKETVSTAESCTGGYIAHLLTSIPGSSSVYDGSIISYSNALKENLLDVPSEIISLKGAVSEDVVIAMAKGCLNQTRTTYSIAVSGIMGPDGGTEEKPVGTVWVCVANKNNFITKKFNFRNDRLRNIQLTAVNALNLLRMFINQS